MKSQLTLHSGLASSMLKLNRLKYCMSVWSPGGQGIGSSRNTEICCANVSRMIAGADARDTFSALQLSLYSASASITSDARKMMTPNEKNDSRQPRMSRRA